MQAFMAALIASRLTRNEPYLSVRKTGCCGGTYWLSHTSVR
jgi:hypothetical protein